MALLTVAEYRTLSQVSADQVPDAQAQALIDAASAAVETYCNRGPLERSTRVEYYAANGTRVIPLRGRPVASVTEVRHDPNSYYGSAPGAFPASTIMTEGVDWALAVRGAGDSPTSLLVRITGVWPEFPRRREWSKLTLDLVPQFGDVMVTYVAGYAPGQVPWDVRLAVSQLTSRLANKAKDGVPVGYEKLGDWAKATSETFLLGNPELGDVRQLLSKHKDVPW